MGRGYEPLSTEDWNKLMRANVVARVIPKGMAVPGLGGQDFNGETPIPSPTPTPSITPTQTITPTPTLTPTPTPSPSVAPVFPDWETTGNTGSQFLSALSYETSTGSFDETTRIQIPGAANVSQAFIGSVAAPSDKIYGIPFTEANIAVVNTSTSSVSTFASLGAGAKWAGGVLASNGFIYGIPHSSTQFLKINLSTNATSLVGSIAGVSKYWGGVLAQNNSIYCVPRNATSVLKIDTATDTITSFGSLGATGDKWRGGVLAPNGKIYCSPRAATDVLVIDPSTDTTSTFSASTNGYLGIELGADGYLYCIGGNSNNVLKIDPSTDTTTTILSGLTDGSFDFTISPAGTLVGISTLVSGGTLSFDPSIPSFNEDGTYVSDTQIGSATLGSDGRIYCFPFNSPNVLVIGQTGTTLSEDFVLSRYVNKL
jgi:hypothetical protein